MSRRRFVRNGAVLSMAGVSREQDIELGVTVIPESIVGLFSQVQDNTESTITVVFSDPITESDADDLTDDPEEVLSFQDRPNDTINIRFTANEINYDVDAAPVNIDPDYAMSSDLRVPLSFEWAGGTWFDIRPLLVERPVEGGAPAVEGEFDNRQRFWVTFPTGYTYRLPKAQRQANYYDGAFFEYAGSTDRSIPRLPHFDHPSVTALAASAEFRHNLLGEAAVDGVRLTRALDPDWYIETALEELVDGLNDIYAWLVGASVSQFVPMEKLLGPEVAAALNLKDILDTLDTDLENFEAGLEGLSGATEVIVGFDRRQWMEVANETLIDLGWLSDEELHHRNPALALAHAPEDVSPNDVVYPDDSMVKRVDEYREILEKQRSVLTDLLDPRSDFKATRDAFVDVGDEHDDDELGQDDYWGALHSFTETLFTQYLDRVNKDLELLADLETALEEAEEAIRAKVTDRERTIQPGTRLLFEADIEDVDSDWAVEWKIDGEQVSYTAHWHALTADYYQYVEKYEADYFYHTFDSIGVYEVTASVFYDVDVGRQSPNHNPADTERWTVNITPDGKTQPSVVAADPDPNEPIIVGRSEPFEVSLDITSPDSNLDRAVWWLSQADIILGFHDLEGNEDTVTLSIDEGEGCHTCRISPWIITEDGLLMWPDSWEIDHMAD